MEYWSIHKPAVRSHGGIVVAQHAEAARVGADVLARGGNAIDAAIACGFALGAVEPWMSGVGGCGFMTVYLAKEKKSYAVEFGVRASETLRPEDYPLSRGFDSDLFAWPGVLDNRNVLGPLSVAVPGYVAGVAMALERFGSWHWADVLEPAVKLARSGFTADWYSSLKIASSAKDLARFESSRSVYLPDGHVPMGQWAAAPPTVRINGLATTLQELADAGPEAFYRGKLAQRILDDCTSVGISLTQGDLANYQARTEVLTGAPFRNGTIFAPQGLCAGPTLTRALANFEGSLDAVPGEPNAAYYGALARGLEEAYTYRLANMGHSPDGRASASTTHLNVIDRDGNVVSLTQTLLSIFGSKLMLPATGILMNNGIMWFDPQAGRPNSLMPGMQPLSNMCPAIVVSPTGSIFAAGASGGRRIVSSVMQLIAFMSDFGMDPQWAMHQPRIDVSGSGQVLIDMALDQHVQDSLRAAFGDVAVAQHGVFPSMFSCPSIALWDPKERCSMGSAFVTSPAAAAVAEHSLG